MIASYSDWLSNRGYPVNICGIEEWIVWGSALGSGLMVDK